MTTNAAKHVFIRLRACLASLLLAASGCRMLQPPQPSPDFHLTEAETDFARALSHYARGLLYDGDLGKGSGEAMAEYSQASQLDPRNYRLLTSAATSALYGQKPDKAIEILSQLCRMHPESVRCRLDLASIYQLVGDVPSALACYREALSIDPGRTIAYWESARLYFDERKDSEALDIISEALKKSDNAAALVPLFHAQAVDFVRAKEMNRAIPCFSLLAKASPIKRSEFQNLLGEIHNAQGDQEEAVRWFSLATKGNSPLASSFIRLSTIQLKSSPEDAIHTLQAGHLKLPDNESITLRLAYVYTAESRFDEAIDVIRNYQKMLLEKENQDLTQDLYIFYAHVCEQAGRRSEAEEAMSDCLIKHPDAHEALNYLAYSWAERGENLDKALEYVRKALEHEPDNGAYVDTLGWVFFQQKKYPEALKQIQRAAELMPADPTIAEHLGDIKAAMNRMDEAIGHWSNSLMLLPDENPAAQKLADQGVDVNTLIRKAREKKSSEKNKQDSKQDN